MAYKTKELLDKALEAIEKHKLIFIDEVVSFMECSKSTFYEHKLEQSDQIKKKIQINKDEMKAGLRRKWYASENPTVQIVLYKLIATDDENDKINNQRIKHEFPEGIIVNLIDGSGS